MLVSALTTLNAQAWIRPNATWHYSFAGVMERGFVKIEYASDTLIDGHNCQRLDGKMYKFFEINAAGDQVMDVMNWGRWYTYLSGDTVFYRVRDRFEILYNFAATIGETWNVLTDSIVSICNDTSGVRVLQQGQVTIAGVDMPYSVTGDTENSSVGFGNYADVNTQIVSRIGNVQSGFLFPITRNCDPNTVEDLYEYAFTCYEDDEIYYNPYGGYCEYFLGLTATVPFALSVFPNPANDQLTVNIAAGNCQYQVLSLTGEIVASGVLLHAQANVLTLSVLKPGIYVLKVSDEQKQTGVVRFAKE